MSVYFGTTEITNFDNLVPQSGLDVTDIWFGSTNVYTVWTVYEDTLPATFNANGDDMRQYQIFGNTGGVGDDSGTAYGYEADMAVGSNILQSSEIEQGDWNAPGGNVPQKIVYPQRCRSKNIYTFSSNKIFYDAKSINLNVAFVDSNGFSLGGAGFKTGTGSVDVPANAVQCFFIIANTDTSANIIPSQVIKAGIWASIDATITPIYIGDEPLGKDEYVDFKEQKVYRKIDNVLTPTDPPVALPALPTCEGTTIVDYAGSGTAPEKVVLEYRKENF